MEKFGFASDHAGFALKQLMIEYFKEKGIECSDYGCYSQERADYPDFGHKLADAVLKGECTMGFAFCGSGNGIAMTLNRHKGVRAAICWCEEIAALAHQHNDANVCVIPGRFFDKEQAVKIAEAFLSTPYEGGRHQTRIEKIDKFL